MHLGHAQRLVLRCVNCALVVFRARKCKVVVPSLCLGLGVAMACLVSARNRVAARGAHVVWALFGQLERRTAITIESFLDCGFSHSFDSRRP